MVKDKNLEWFPRLRAISLAAEGEESEKNEIRSLQMTEYRKQKQRMGLLNSAPAYFHHLSQ
ncbi:hypothetical protein DAPPUDRAFT_259642 [Daphnia pulex]|uniref:Uncharacterized protein n=1 Tax=Daphnia pulex TaxID=6669 RepID=E9HHK3_DAPPU|nr:hypothetical protein DAPPUDRAFT_259642 [Daphnia pulex]|eukprot:EFX68794.1 hypothetical protein DAPPUDRAFT_259642 [Daphnia pulex]